MIRIIRKITFIARKAFSRNYFRKGPELKKGKKEQKIERKAKANVCVSKSHRTSLRGSVNIHRYPPPLP